MSNLLSGNLPSREEIRHSQRVSGTISAVRVKAGGGRPHHPQRAGPRCLGGSDASPGTLVAPVQRFSRACLSLASGGSRRSCVLHPVAPCSTAAGPNAAPSSRHEVLQPGLWHLVLWRDPVLQQKNMAPGNTVPPAQHGPLRPGCQVPPQSLAALHTGNLIELRLTW